MTQTIPCFDTLPVPDDKSILVVPLGGTERVGMNATLIGHAGKWIMIDAGATFAGADNEEAAVFGEHFGGKIQQIIPDMRAIRSIVPRLAGIVITHAHEDHIGALSTMFAYSEAWSTLCKVPLYAGAYARGVIRRKLEEVGIKPRIGQLKGRQPIRIGPFKITPIGITHSAPETFMLAITTPIGTVMFGSDYKLDREPILGRATDTDSLAGFGSRGVLAALLDSTGANYSGRSNSEGEVSRNIAEIMLNHPGRVIVSTFASNLARVAGLVRAADQTGRKIAAAGRTIFNNVETAVDVQLADPRSFAFTESWAAARMDPRDVAYVCTGTQAEQGSALRRAVEDLERDGRTTKGIQIEKGDLVIHSARTIPGNEKTVQAMFDTLRRLGVHVLDPETAKQPIHASGHGKRSEIEDMYRMLKPRFAIPVHGHAELTSAHNDIARSAKSVVAATTPGEGEILRIDGASMSVVGRISIGQLALLSIGDRNSGETRLLPWHNAPRIDMRRGSEPAPEPRNRQEPRFRPQKQVETGPKEPALANVGFLVR